MLSFRGRAQVNDGNVGPAGVRQGFGELAPVPPEGLKLPEQDGFSREERLAKAFAIVRPEWLAGDDAPERPE